MNSIQSVLFEKTWDIRHAINWLIRHGFVANKMHETNNYYRFRQFEPRASQAYRTKKIPGGISFVIAVSRGGRPSASDDDDDLWML